MDLFSQHISIPQKKEKGEIVLRDYQQDIVDTINKHIKKPLSRIMCCLPTGGGKTIAFSFIAKEYQKLGKRVLVLTHRKELLMQSDGTFSKFGINAHNLTAESKEIPSSDIVVGMVETLYRRLENKNGYIDFLNSIDLVIIDEAHIGQFDKLFKYFKNTPAVLGVSATPYRRNPQTPLSTFYHVMVQGPDVKSLIKAGYLSEATVYGQRIDLSNVGLRSGDYRAEDLEAEFTAQNLYSSLLEQHQKIVKGKKTLIFTPTVASAIEVAARFRERGVHAEYVHAETPKVERRKIFKRFKEVDDMVLVNQGITTLGFDEPSIEVVVLFRATRSLQLYLQMCLDMQTEILTVDGWKTCDEVSEKENILTFNHYDNSIYPEIINEKIERRLHESESFYSYTSPHLDYRVTNKHQLIWGSPNTKIREWKKDDAEILAERKSEYLLPVNGFKYDEAQFLTNDELTFIGWVLSDGTINKTTKQITISQSVSQPKEHHESIVNAIKGCGFKHGEHTIIRNDKMKGYPNLIQYTISYGNPRGRDSHLTGYKKLAPYLDKQISDDLMKINKNQLEILLHAIHLGDGAKQLGQYWTRRSYHISTGDKVYADRLQTLCITKGFSCNISTLDYNLNPLYILRIKSTRTRYIGGSSYKDRPILKDEGYSDEKVWCVNTPTGNIITRRNGKVLIMGNCGRGSRVIEDFKDSFIILDFGNNTSRFGFYDDDREWSLENDTTNFKKETTMTKICPQCNAVVPLAKVTCACGYVWTKQRKEQLIEEIKIELIPLKGFAVEEYALGKSFEELQAIQEVKGYKKNWIFHQLQSETDLRMYGKFMGYKHGWIDHALKSFNPKTIEEKKRDYEAFINNLKHRS